MTPGGGRGFARHGRGGALRCDGQTFNGYGTKRVESIGTLSNPTPGTSITYYLNMTWNLTQTVTDGPGSKVKAGPIITITCPIEVHNFSG
jgi:hypothetical protein